MSSRQKRTYTGKCDLGKEAIPNTGVPGNIGGFTTERLIRASADGIMEPVAEIGDTVEKGQLVARTGKQPVYAKMSGIVRGMLQKDVQVTEGLKIGDIDARCEPEHCGTISDKQGQSEVVCWKRYLCLDRSMEIMEWHFWQQGKQNGLEVTSCRKISGNPALSACT